MSLVKYTALPYLERRVLRILVANPGITDLDLDLEADLDGSARPQVDHLVLLGLAARVGRSYIPTDAGERCIASAGHSFHRHSSQASPAQLNA